MPSPFALTPEPDILAAITARLRLFTEITALTSSRISGEIGDDWFPRNVSGQPAGRPAIRLRHTGGPVRLDGRLIGLVKSRFDVWCYGASAKNANDVMRYTLAALCPTAGKPGSFTQTVTNDQTVRVYGITPETEPISDREPDTKLRYTWVPIVADWSLINA